MRQTGQRVPAAVIVGLNHNPRNSPGTRRLGVIIFNKNID